MPNLSGDARTTAGVLLLTILVIEYGGWFLLRLLRRGRPATEFQKAFVRAGHAHAGVLVLLSLVGLLYVDAAHLAGLPAVVARNGIWLAAILMPAGFFLSAVGRGRMQPSRLVGVLYLGALSLALGVGALGLGLLTA